MTVLMELACHNASYAWGTCKRVCPFYWCTDCPAVVVFLARGRLTSRPGLVSSARLTEALLAAGSSRVGEGTGSVDTGTPLVRPLISVCYAAGHPRIRGGARDSSSKRPAWDHPASYSMGTARASPGVNFRGIKLTPYLNLSLKARSYLCL
jgi:hypothetical protein